MSAIETRILRAARRLYVAKMEVRRLRAERAAMECERVVQPPYLQAQPCWKNWRDELSEEWHKDETFTAEDLGEGWCETCQKRWRITQPAYAKAMRKHGAAAGALTNALRADAATGGVRS